MTAPADAWLLRYTALPTWLQQPALHLFHQQCSLWAAQQTLHILQASACSAEEEMTGRQLGWGGRFANIPSARASLSLVLFA